jgi:NADH dehydrogenase
MRVLIIGGGFAGLNAAKTKGNKQKVEVTLIDRSNYHLFQPLLYQVAMAGLSPAEIAVPIRSLLAGYRNINVLQGKAISFDLRNKTVHTDQGDLVFDYLIIACGVQHTYFGHEEWEEYAPGLKTIEQATEIRRRILTAYEKAESEKNAANRKELLTFIIVGGGPTGVELAGAIGEMSRFTLAKDFKHIDPRLTRVILLEAGPRILPSFSEAHSGSVTRDLEKLGVQVWTKSLVTKVDAEGVEIGKERILASTVLWAAGVKASDISHELGSGLDKFGRVIVEPDLSLKGYPDVFVVGDQAHFAHQTGIPLPGLAPVALQQGRFVARNIIRLVNGKARVTFRYVDKGQMATVGRGRAIVEIGRFRLSGLIAWLAWLFVHIYYLTGFKNRFLVVMHWAWYFFTFRKGARLIVNKEWRLYDHHKQ